MESRPSWRWSALGVVTTLGFALVGCSAKAPAPTSEPDPGDQAATAELVEPATRDPNQWNGARANDGTPFGFALRLSPTGSKDWVVYLQGGGFCDDQAISCATRSGAHITSPPSDDGGAIALPTGGIFSTDPALNPSFHDANVAFAFYSSSDAWSGATTTARPVPSRGEDWYFSGRTNVRATFEVLIDEYGLDDTDPETRVLFAGSSAGGGGVDANADQAAALLPEAASDGRLLLVNDGGFMFDFVDPDHPAGDSGLSVRDLLPGAYELWGARHLPSCEADHVAAPSECFLLPVNHPYIVEAAPSGLGLPLLVQTSSLDSYALDLHHIDDPSDPSDAAAYETWRACALEALADVDRLFSGGERPYHTILGDTAAWSMGPSGSTFGEALTEFWDGGPPERIVFGNPDPLADCH